MTTDNGGQWDHIAAKLDVSRATRFDELVRASGIDPGRQLRFGDFSGVDFSGCDLRGFDFFGARLHDCVFTDAQISGACFDEAELGAVLHEGRPNTHEAARMTGLADLRNAADWKLFAAESLDPTRAEHRQRRVGRSHLPVGAIFSDASGLAPEMVVVPGNPAFAIGRFAVTLAEWDAAQAHPEWRKLARIEPRKPNDYGWGRGKQPAIDVSWNDAKAYCAWLSGVTGRTYRLPSEAEWELACRADSTTEYWWGNEISTAQANYDGNFTFGNGNKGEYRQRTVPVDSFEANPWGLYQVHGNVWEWCEDAYDASSRVLRGGSWSINPQDLRSAIRVRDPPVNRNYDVGFRLARTLLPL